MARLHLRQSPRLDHGVAAGKRGSLPKTPPSRPAQRPLAGFSAFGVRVMALGGSRPSWSLHVGQRVAIKKAVEHPEGRPNNLQNFASIPTSHLWEIFHKWLNPANNRQVSALMGYDAIRSKRPPPLNG